MKRTIFAAVLAAWACTAMAHGGAVDRYGCHSQNGVRHCHRDRDRSHAPMGLEDKAKRDRRMRIECRGRPNSGVCYGYAN